MNASVFDERVLQIRSSKTHAFIAIQFGPDLAGIMLDWCIFLALVVKIGYRIAYEGGVEGGGVDGG